MEISNAIAACSMLLALPPGIVAVRDLARVKDASKGRKPSHKPNSIMLAILCLFSFGMFIGFGFWMFFDKPLRPVIVERINTMKVEKQIPCPPTRTGPATQRGPNGIAHSGSGDTYTITPPAQTPKRP